MTGQEFKEWRLRLSLTQQAAAEILGLSIETIRSWEYGKRQISIPTVLHFACYHLEHCHID